MAATTRARAQWDGWLEASPGEEATARLLDERLIDRYRDEVRAALADRQPSPIAAEPPGPSNTSHLSVIDADGLAVGLTTTAGESAGYVVGGTGYIPNNMLGEEDLHPVSYTHLDVYKRQAPDRTADWYSSPRPARPAG